MFRRTANWWILSGYLFDVFACVLAGDEEEVYWCCGRLADRSIVVMDGNGNYYHVEKGKEKAAGINGPA